jgi:hypothetical protein
MKIVLMNNELGAKDKRILLVELRKNNANSADRWTYRYAIWILGGAVILTIAALWVLTYHGNVDKIPEGLVALGSAAAGGLAGLLTPSHATESNQS